MDKYRVDRAGFCRQNPHFVDKQILLRRFRVLMRNKLWKSFRLDGTIKLLNNVNSGFVFSVWNLSDRKAFRCQKEKIWALFLQGAFKGWLYG